MQWNLKHKKKCHTYRKGFVKPAFVLTAVYFAQLLFLLVSAQKPKSLLSTRHEPRFFDEISNSASYYINTQVAACTAAEYLCVSLPYSCVCQLRWEDGGIILCRSFPGLNACRESRRDCNAVCWGWGVCDTWQEGWADVCWGWGVCDTWQEEGADVCWGWGVCDTWLEEWADWGRCA